MFLNKAILIMYFSVRKHIDNKSFTKKMHRSHSFLQKSLSISNFSAEMFTDSDFSEIKLTIINFLQKKAH